MEQTLLDLANAGLHPSISRIQMIDSQGRLVDVWQVALTARMGPALKWQNEESWDKPLLMARNYMVQLQSYEQNADFSSLIPNSVPRVNP